jgi:phosphoadenosine phosphosulfate reductase
MPDAELLGLDKAEVDALSQEFESKDAVSLLQWALTRFHPKIVMASSFGAEDVVIIDMLSKINSEARVITLDTGRLHQETYDVMDEVRQRYGIKVEVYFPDQGAVERMVTEHGLNLFYKSVEFRKLCCGIRKVEPLNRALAGLDAWIAGLRRDQVQTRSTIRKVEIDEQHNGILKINPIADWTWENVWDYVRKNAVPYNKLHDLGYPSIGCEPCTRAVMPGEDPRAGRWWWEQGAQKECGLHFDPTKKGSKDTSW